MQNLSAGNKLITIIHVGKNKLGMDGDTYRAFLFNATKKRSCSDMTTEELKRVVALLNQKGFKSTSGAQKAGIINKIREKWHEMHQDGIIRDNTERALNNYVAKLTKNQYNRAVISVNWLNNSQAIKVLETLKKWQQREKGEHYVADNGDQT